MEVYTREVLKEGRRDYICLQREIDDFCYLRRLQEPKIYFKNNNPKYLGKDSNMDFTLNIVESEKEIFEYNMSGYYLDYIDKKGYKPSKIPCYYGIQIFACSRSIVIIDKRTSYYTFYSDGSSRVVDTDDRCKFNLHLVKSENVDFYNFIYEKIQVALSKPSFLYETSCAWKYSFQDFRHLFFARIANEIIGDNHKIGYIYPNKKWVECTDYEF